MSWGAMYDNKIALATKVENLVDPDPEAGFHDFVKNIKDQIQRLLETEVRYEAVQRGVVASDDQIAKGVSFLKELYFPELNESLVASVADFSNDCHDENGKFCETHGTIHGGSPADIAKEKIRRSLRTPAQIKAEANKPASTVETPKATPAPAPAPAVETPAPAPEKPAAPVEEEKRGFFKKLFFGSAEEEAAMDERVQRKVDAKRDPVVIERTQLSKEAEALQKDQKTLEKEQKIANRKWYTAASANRTKRAQQRTQALGQSINARQNDMIVKLLQEK